MALFSQAWEAPGLHPALPPEGLLALPCRLPQALLPLPWDVTSQPLPAVTWEKVLVATETRFGPSWFVVMLHSSCQCPAPGAQGAEPETRDTQVSPPGEVPAAGQRCGGGTARLEGSQNRSAGLQTLLCLVPECEPVTLTSVPECPHGRSSAITLARLGGLL